MAKKGLIVDVGCEEVSIVILGAAQAAELRCSSTLKTESPTSSNQQASLTLHYQEHYSARNLRTTESLDIEMALNNSRTTFDIKQGRITVSAVWIECNINTCDSSMAFSSSMLRIEPCQ